MTYSSDRLTWPSEQPLRAQFQPTLDGENVTITNPVLYLSKGPLVALDEREQITEAAGSGTLTVDPPYVKVVVDTELREQVTWYRLDVDTDDGPRTFAAGNIDRVEV